MKAPLVSDVMAEETKMKNKLITIDSPDGGFKVEGNPNPEDVYYYDVGVDPDSPNDISKKTKSTLGAYLSKLTLGKAGSSPSQNKYPIDHTDATPVINVSLTDEKGYPIGPQLSANSKQYDKEISRVRSSQSSAEIEILRGKQAPVGNKQQDGNTLLRFKTTTDAATGRQAIPSTSPIKQYSASLLSNRFVPDTTFDTIGDEGQLFARKYTPGSSTLDLKEEKRRVSYDQLSQIGTELSRLAGLNPEAIAAAVGGFTSQQGESKEVTRSVSQSTLTQVENNLLSARAVLENLSESPEPGSVTKLSIASKSWSSLNTVFEKYDNMSTNGMYVLALALIKSVGISLKILSDSMGNFNLTSRSAQRRDSVARLPYGSYEAVTQPVDYDSTSALYGKLSSGQSSIWELVGLQSTQSDFVECLSVGAMAFFGIDGSLNNDDHLSLSTKPNAGVQNPGFDIVNARAINRSLILLGDSFSSVFQGSNASPPNSQLSPGESQQIAKSTSASFAVRAFNTLISLRESKAVSILNVMAQLGDSIVSYKGYTNDTEVRGIGKKHSSIDKIMNVDSHTKSRMMDGTLKLAWSTHRAQDIIIVPNVVMNAIMRDSSKRALGAPTLVPTESSDAINPNGPGYRMTDPSNQTNLTQGSIAAGGARIPTEVREKIESDLDAEYMPFYLHDVRTNEIISFHAFLTKLSDDYSASYDAQDGFGRVEQIRIYKNTTRKISFSFILAALDEKDFDSMWTKINKLTTMMYPQFTEGTQIQSADGRYSFYQPFSQMISASPMVRLRIGDVVQNNYSKFNLARLFGYGHSQTNFGGNPDPSSSSPDGSINRTGWIEQRMTRNSAISQLHKRVLSYFGDQTYYRNAKSRFYTSSLLTDPYYRPGDTSPAIKPRSMILPRGLLLQYVGPDPSAGSNPSVSPWGLYQVILATEEDDPGSKWYRSEAERRYDNVDNPEEKIVGQKYLFSFSELIPTKDTVRNALRESEKWRGKNATPPEKKKDPEPTVPQKIKVSRDRCGAATMTKLRMGYPHPYKPPHPDPDVVKWQQFLKCKSQEKYGVLLGKFGPKDENGNYTGVDGLHGPNTQAATDAYLADLSAGKVPSTIEEVEIDPKDASADEISAVAVDPPKPSQPQPIDYSEYDSSYMDDIVEFMNDSMEEPTKGNVVAKSFRTTGGRGLAGFIESLSFNWLDNKGTWAGLGSQDAIGNRAPKYCEINVSFAPIHDITPGLDAQGYNRAPLYSVGPFAPIRTAPSLTVPDPIDESET